MRGQDPQCPPLVLVLGSLVLEQETSWIVAISQLLVVLGPFQLHLQDFTTILESCSTLGVRPT